MSEQDFDNFIRDRFDSPLVNALYIVELTPQQRQAIVDEILEWE